MYLSAGPRLLADAVHAERHLGSHMVYLVVGLDHASLSPWHANISARSAARAVRSAIERASATGVDLVVAGVIGPGPTVVAHPVSAPVAGLRAA
jgi:flavin-binding protein dodecin